MHPAAIRHHHPPIYVMATMTKPRRRTLYFNDARHYYLFVFEPPITMGEVITSHTLY